MTGTILNAAAILIGGVAGLTTTKQMTAAHQGLLKGILGVLVVYVGLNMTWESLNGSFAHRVKQLVIVILALILGSQGIESLRLAGTVALWVATIAALVSAANYYRHFNSLFALRGMPPRETRDAITGPRLAGEAPREPAHKRVSA
jgi:uncharacterized membrane protein YqgA involved in biofilm formation